MSLVAFGLPFFWKIVVPGYALSLALSPLWFPLVSYLISHSGWILVQGDKPFGLTALAVLFTGVALALGVLISSARLYIYKLLEGRYRFPGRTYLQNRLKAKVAAYQHEAQEAKDTQRYHEVWSLLRRFPICEETANDYPKVEVRYPTVLGNVICQYEDYPYSRYRMEAIFYYPRLWLSLDENIRREVSAKWAHADAMVFLSFVFGLSAIANFITGIVHVYNAPSLVGGLVGIRFDGLAFPGSPWYFGLFFVSVVMARACYLAAIPLQEEVGGYLRALFDLYRSGLCTKMLVAEDELTRWESARFYFDYLLVRCSNGSCDKVFSRALRSCPKCNASNPQRI